MIVKSAGKRPVMPAWERHCLNASSKEIERWGSLYPSSTNTGRLCVLLAGVDIDVLQPDLTIAIADRARRILGATPLGYSPFPEQRQGKGRHLTFSLSEILKLAMMQKLVGAGLSPSVAALALRQPIDSYRELLTRGRDLLGMRVSA